jgi:hypothetical protein
MRFLLVDRPMLPKWHLKGKGSTENKEFSIPQNP